MDRISEQIEELMLNAILPALKKIKESNLFYSSVEYRPHMILILFKSKLGSRLSFGPGQGNLKKYPLVYNNQVLSVHII